MVRRREILVVMGTRSRLHDFGFYVLSLSHEVHCGGALVLMILVIAHFYYPGARQLIGQHKHVNLRGVAVGNGALDFLTMSPSYAQYMYSRGFIPRDAKGYFDRKWRECLDGLLVEAGSARITVRHRVA